MEARDSRKAGETQPSGGDFDRRVGTLLCKGMNGDTQGMLRDLATLLLEAYRDARAQQLEATSKPM